ncbi:MAG: cryptochrome/photolyase family protein [Legionellaceae bacterium]|nr:cryptochrome/photolyase family protein [Legionellaceae bacterium]
MKTLRLILGDQLSESISSLEGYNHMNDHILMCEVIEEATYVKHHKKKIVLIFSAMRHFAQGLQKQGMQVSYSKLDAPDNGGSFKEEVRLFIENHDIERIIVTEPSEYRVLESILSWQSEFGVAVEIRDDERFLCSRKQFSAWAHDRKQLRMEYFYREMRKQYQILMNQMKPIGDKWNYDAENRKVPKEGLPVPATYQIKPDVITQEVMGMVAERFDDHFGELEPFHFAVTREGALGALKSFIENRLPIFGDYQDAMLTDEPWMYHAHIGMYINIGLLLPLECIQDAEKAYQEGQAPLNSVEGFIRQILGWREYVRGIYWLKMPEYKKANFFDVKRKLPDFYWTGETKMNCISQCVKSTRELAYAHHIQRLMVLGNFALIAGLHPDDVNEWFLIVYADAFEWVEMPNVTGMILFADGGYLGSKPYAAGGSYINKMSDYCKKCHYKVSKKNGETACPFNYLYWDFLARNRVKLQGNARLGMMYKTYDRMNDEKKQAIAQDSAAFLDSL